MKVKVLIDTLNHDGRKRVPGELIEVNDYDVEQLISAGAAEIVPEEKPGDVDKSTDAADDKTSDKSKKESKIKDK